MVSQYDMMLADTSMHMDGLPSLGPGSRVSAGALLCGALLWWEGGGWVGEEGGPDAETDSEEPER